jgi:hypothetical protein
MGTRAVFAPLMVAIVALGCRSSSGKLDLPDPPRAGPLVVPRPDAIITTPASDDARDVLLSLRANEIWTTLTETTEAKPSAAHDGMFVVTRTNEVANHALHEGLLPYPDGSILVAENRSSPDASTLVSLTTMAKRNGQWFWLESAEDRVVMLPDGTRLEGVALGACTRCHGYAIASDGVLGAAATRVLSSSLRAPPSARASRR